MSRSRLGTKHEVTVRSALLCVFASVAAAQEPASAWPEVTVSAKPWTRWWWPGSAVDKVHLTAQLEAIAAAGIGGVEITPIYGPRGSEARYVDFLSPQWMEMLEHTAREAARLGLSVDMATGTGWPFGGPSVSAADGSSSLALVDGKLVAKPTGDAGVTFIAGGLPAAFRRTTQGCSTRRTPDRGTAKGPASARGHVDAQPQARASRVVCSSISIHCGDRKST